MNRDPIFINSKITGGHFALQTKKSSKPFENNMKECKSIKLFQSDIVADIGAYIGEYSLWALKNRVEKVLSFEPTPYTFKILTMNTNTFHNIELFNAAVIGNHSKYVDLYLSKGIGVTNSIAKCKPKKIKVKAIKYEDAVKNATVVKIDVEGAEYMYNIVQPQLRAIILEFHPLSKKPWKDMAFKIIENIENSSFKSIVKPTFKSGWNLTGSWQR